MKKSYFGIMQPLMFGGAASKKIVNPVLSINNTTLDPRVSYIGPPHAFFSQSGELVFSKRNEWPLEYHGGVAIGRHQPEGAAVNYMASTDFSSIGSVGSGSDWIYSSGSSVIVGEGSLGQVCAFTVDNAKNTAVYNESTSSFTSPPLFLSTGNRWIRFIRKGSNPNDAINRIYIARVDSNAYLYGKTPVAVPAGKYTASGYRMVSGSNLLSCLPQMELGDVATSPIMRNSELSGVREASSVRITEPMATSALVEFNNGESIEVMSIDGVVTLPISDVDWSTRYITQITLRK